MAGKRRPGQCPIAANLFGGHDRLVLAINARTLRAWADSMRARLDASPADRLAALVGGYFDFASENRNRWMALYDHRMADGFELPGWFLAAFEELIALLQREVAAQRPGCSEEEARVLTGSCAAIAHGHCMFALNGTHNMFGEWDPRQAALRRIRQTLG